MAVTLKGKLCCEKTLYWNENRYKPCWPKKGHLLSKVFFNPISFVCIAVAYEIGAKENWLT